MLFDTELSEKDALLEAAWSLIANASGGDWKKESPEWVKGAEKWRDQWLAQSPKRIGEGSIVRRYLFYKEVFESLGGKLDVNNIAHWIQAIKPGGNYVPENTLDAVKLAIDELSGSRDWRCSDGGLWYPCLSCGLPIDHTSAGGMTCGWCDCGTKPEPTYLVNMVAYIRSSEFKGEDTPEEIIARFERFKETKKRSPQFYDNIDLFLLKMKEGK